MRHEIDKVKVRDELTPRREPYWGPRLERGVYIGCRKLPTGDCTWIARRLDDDGVHRYHAIGYTDDLDFDEAVKRARKWAQAASNGVDAGKRRTIADVCREYVADRRREKGDAAADAIEGHYRRSVYTDTIGKVRVERLRSAQVKAWRAGLSGAPATRNRVLTALRAALNYAVSSRYVEESRAIEWRSVKTEEATSKRDLYLVHSQRAALIEALPEYARPFVRALAMIPLRPGALAQCTVADLQGNMLAIRHDKAHAGRTLQLPATTAALLRDQARGKTPGAPLIAMPDGGPWTKDAWRAVIQQAAKTAKLPHGVCAYTLRHSGISELLAAGTDSLTVARLAGTSIGQIEATYGHLLQRHGASAMEALRV